MRTIDEVISDWKTEFGTIKYGVNGEYYKCINWKIEKNLLFNLAQMLVDEGFGKSDLVSEKVTSDGRTYTEPNLDVRNKIIEANSAPPGASSRKKSEILKSKRITAEKWATVLKEFFRGPVSEHIPKERELDIPAPSKEEKPKKILEIDPSDRIKIDTSDVADSPLDLGFLEDLGLDETFMTGKADE